MSCGSGRMNAEDPKINKLEEVQSRVETELDVINRQIKAFNKVIKTTSADQRSSHLLEAFTKRRKKLII